MLQLGIYLAGELQYQLVNNIRFENLESLIFLLFEFTGHLVLVVWFSVESFSMDDHSNHMIMLILFAELSSF